MPEIKLETTTYHYQIQGTGPRLVLIAGAFIDQSVWDKCLKHLTDHFEILTFDNPSTGKTPLYSITLESLAKDVTNLMQSIGWSKAHIAGQSMGGTVAQCLAAKFPEYVDKLALITTTSKWSSCAKCFFNALLASAEKHLPKEIINTYEMGLFFSDKLLQNESKKEELMQFWSDNPLSIETRKSHTKVLINTDTRGILANINAKTLVIATKDDLVSPPKDSKYLKDHISNSTYLEIDTAHAVHIEKPDELSNGLIDFFIE